MNILKELLEHQVYPAMGCTEPVSVALCAAHAAKALGKTPQTMQFTLDSGTYKNGMGVNLPNTGGEKGNLLAGVMGALLAAPERGMEILKAADPALARRAGRYISSGAARMSVASGKSDIYIEARLRAGKDRAACVISGAHTHVSRLEKNSRAIISSRAEHSKPAAYKAAMAKLTIEDMARLADKAGKEELDYIRSGVEMNLAASNAGMKLKKVGYYLMDLRRRGFLQNDVFSSSKILAACAADARMDGIALPVMSSGESGNQGIVAALIPYNVGRAFGVPERKIYKSICLSHLLNGYVKLFTGGLAPICGCAIAAGVGAAAAIVYQRRGPDAKALGLAVNNVVSDLGGMLCDGAKSGCALKVVSSADCAIRSAYMGMHGYGISEREGFVGETAEESIRNLAKISTAGMHMVDPTIVGIMLDKQARLRTGGPPRKSA
ncbi:MAG: L-serine ammonia-lyase, iron-sulfur-dependent, subunit alpha [Elusimicrobiales bacterium]